MTPPDRKRTFLFLQGLASGFFDRLGRTLIARGHGVIRVNLNAGDRVFWRQPGALDYRGRPEAWRTYVAELIADRDITDIVLFGDCRPMHREAIEVAGTLLLAVHVVEEGYLRPDWVTIELGGVNGHSSLPRNPDWYRETAVSLPAVNDVATIPSSFNRRAREDVLYNMTAMLLRPLYPFYKTHRPWHPLIEYAGWLRRLVQRPAARRRSEAMMQRMHTGDPYYLFPLQLDCDSQIRLHSSFKGMAAVIRTVLTSFATLAPPHTLLVVKEHPLDNGLINWRKLTLDLAATLGITDRLVYLEQGDIAYLVRDARGVVTVNSTTGTFALAAGVPVITLGHAIYALPGLTFQGELDQFWTDHTTPDAALYDAFRRVLVDRCLIRGGFFSDEGLDMLVTGAVGRLEAAAPAPMQASAASARRPTFGPSGAVASPTR